MIDRDTIDKVEQYLFSSTMDQLPNVLGRVLPWMFSEMRILVDLQEAKTEEFFNAGVKRNNGTPTARSEGAGPAGLVAGADQELPAATEDAPDKESVKRAEPLTKEAELLARLAADRGSEGRDNGELDEGAMEPAVGGPLRLQPRHESNASSKQADAVLKPRKRRRK
jgi:hypothetical protein